MIDSPFVRSVILNREDVPAFSKYPFHLPSIKTLNQLTFHPKVTYLIGENGMGKSTLLEAIAVSLGFNPEGGSFNFNFSTFDTHSELTNYIKLIKGIDKPRDGFFLRAESFYNVASNIEELEQSGLGPKIISSSMLLKE